MRYTIANRKGADTELVQQTPSQPLQHPFTPRCYECSPFFRVAILTKLLSDEGLEVQKADNGVCSIIPVRLTDTMPDLQRRMASIAAYSTFQLTRIEAPVLVPVTISVTQIVRPGPGMEAKGGHYQSVHG